jgi:hypothetical protein
VAASLLLDGTYRSRQSIRREGAVAISTEVIQPTDAETAARGGSME